MAICARNDREHRQNTERVCKIYTEIYIRAHKPDRKYREFVNRNSSGSSLPLHISQFGSFFNAIFAINLATGTTACIYLYNQTNTVMCVCVGSVWLIVVVVLFAFRFTFSLFRCTLRGQMLCGVRSALWCPMLMCIQMDSNIKYFGNLVCMC